MAYTVTPAEAEAQVSAFERAYETFKTPGRKSLTEKIALAALRTRVQSYRRGHALTKAFGPDGKVDPKKAKLRERLDRLIQKLNSV